MEKKATFKNALIGGLAGHIKPKKTKTVKTLVFPRSYSPSGRSFEVTVKPLKQKRIKKNTI